VLSPTSEGDDDEAEIRTGGHTFTLRALSAPIAIDEVFDNIFDVDGRSLLL
jgi:hypothetical protein